MTGTEYPLCVTDRVGRIMYRHLRENENGVYVFRGIGFVDPLDCQRFGWTVRPMNANETVGHDEDWTVIAS